MSNWDTFDEDGLPQTPDYASVIRNRPTAEPAPSRAYRPGYPTPGYRRIPDYDPAPRALNQRDVKAYDAYQDREHIHDTARILRRDEFRLRQIERLRDTNYEAYSQSCWPDVYAKMTGAAQEAADRSK